MNNRVYTLCALLACLWWACLVSAGPAFPQSLEGNREEEAAEFQDSRDLFLRQEKIIFAQGDLLLEFSSLYSTNTSTLFNLELKSRVWDNAFAVQYGLWDGVQLGLRFPVLVNAVQEANDVVRGTSVRDEDRGVGDIGGDIRYQLMGEGMGKPDLILDVNAKSTTGGQTLRGSGHWNIGGGLTMVKTIDPVVVFARLGYTGVLPHNGFNPGDIVEYRAGIGFSLNDRVSLNTQLSGAFIGRSRDRGTEIPRSSQESASVLLATTILLDRHLSIEPVMGVGLTDDANDFMFGMRIPYRF